MDDNDDIRETQEDRLALEEFFVVKPFGAEELMQCIEKCL
jgi:hypothetical protein